jgi:hypothetical protein
MHEVGSIRCGCINVFTCLRFVWPSAARSNPFNFFSFIISPSFCFISCISSFFLLVAICSCSRMPSYPIQYSKSRICWSFSTPSPLSLGSHELLCTCIRARELIFSTTSGSFAPLSATSSDITRCCENTRAPATHLDLLRCYRTPHKMRVR